MTQERADYGHARAVDIRATTDSSEVYDLWLTPDGGDRITLQASREALRGLWAHLTKILYPRAGSQLTKRAETVKAETNQTAPMGVTHRLVAYTDDAHPGLIVISGFAKDAYWIATIDQDAGDSLWTALQDQVG